jgi:hypothetical protein
MFALKLPEAEEGIACAGTSLEKRTIKARGKAFLFLGQCDAMLKLGDSLGEATALASKQPDRCKVGAHGWVTVALSPDLLPLEILQRWIEESYRLLAPKQLVERLGERNVARGAKTAKPAAARKTPIRKKAAPQKAVTKKARLR